MSIVPSLLQAVIHVDGDALVMHAGDKPYIVSTKGQTDVASRGLSLDAINGIVNQLLPAEFRGALDEFGAVQYELKGLAQFPDEHFTIVAARGGDDVWVEIRRRRVPDEDKVPEELFAAPPGAALQPASAASVSVGDDDVVPMELLEETPHARPVEQVQAHAVDERAAASGQRVDESDFDDLRLPDAAQLWPSDEAAEPEITVDLDSPETEETTPAEAEPAYVEPVAFELPEPVAAEKPVPVAIEQPEPVAVEEPAPVAIEASAPVAVAPPAPIAFKPPVQIPIELPAPVAFKPPVDIPIEPAAPTAFKPPVLIPIGPPAPIAFKPLVEIPIEPLAPAAFKPVVEIPIEPPAPIAFKPVVEIPIEPPAPVAFKPVMEIPIEPLAPVAFKPLVEIPIEPPAPVAFKPVVEIPIEPPAPVAFKPVVEIPIEPLAPVAFKPLVEIPIEPPAPVAFKPLVQIPSEPPASVAFKPLVQIPSEPPAPVAFKPVVPIPTEPLAPVAFKPVVAIPMEAPAPVAFKPPMPIPMEQPAPVAIESPVPVAVEPSAPVAVEEPTPLAVEEPAPAAVEESLPEPQHAVVLPLSRSAFRSDAPAASAADHASFGLDRLLRVSAARGASTLYLSSGAQPSIRVDGALHLLEGEPELTARDVESLLLTLMPERNHEALRSGVTTEWILDIEDVGRVRCMSFRDHRGPGGVFRLMPLRSVSVDQLVLPRTIQALAMEAEGLVLVAGPRSSGKRTMIAAYIDLINRTRRDHVITIEREINIVHERGNSFISQREVRGSDDDMLAAARAALREDPDVLIIEDLCSAGLMNVALEAAASGRLVIGGVSAHSAASAIDRTIDLYAADDRRHVQLALAKNLRGVVVQVLLHKVGGGRVAAREVLLNTPAVASALAEGTTSQLPMTIEGGRKHGMTPLNDSLAGFVQAGVVDSREAYRHSNDRSGFLALLKRQGFDTSFAERLA